MQAFSPTWLLKIRGSAKELLPRESLLCLRPFLMAFERRLVELGLVSQGACTPPLEFSEWVSKRFSISAELDVFSLVQLRYGQDEFAFQQFFVLLDEFLSMLPHPPHEPPPWSGTKSGPDAITIDRREWFRQIRVRPSLFLGEKSLTALYALIQGDRYALSLAGVVANEIPSLTDIETRIRRQFGYPQDCDARQVLLLHSGFDEGKAFDSYYQFTERI